MNVPSTQNNLSVIAVSIDKAKVAAVEKEELEKSTAVAAAEIKANQSEGITKDVILANIDAATINPELINNLKLFRFHTEKDYLKTQREIGKKIDIFNTHES